MNAKNLSFGLNALTALVVAGSSSVAWGQDLEVLPGFDLFNTDSSQTQFGGIPFEGVPLDPPIFDFPGVGFRAIGDTDTFVQRLDVASAPAGGTDTIDIELIVLSLRSQIPIDVDGPDPAPPDPPSLPPDFLYVTLQKDRTMADELAGFPVGPSSEGTMDITFVSADGGTFDSQFTVYIDLRFGGPDGPILCDPPLPTCAELDAGFLLNASGVQWGRIPPADSLRITGVNRFLAGAGDSSKDFWAPVDPDGFRTECIPHTGHPGGVPITHCTGATSCLTSSIVDGSGCDGLDNTCNGVVDECSEDVTLPELDCPFDELDLECVPDIDVSPPAIGVCTAEDDCNPPVDVDSEDIVTPQCGNTFDVDRIWTATDDCGNTAPRLQLIHVVDTTPPDIDCPFDELILECVPDIDVSPPTVGVCIAADVCDPSVDPIFEDDRTPQCGDTFDVDRIWTATDDCDNDTPYLQQIYVVDTTEPDIVCPENTRILWTDDRSPDANGFPIADDICGEVDIEFDDDPVPGVCLSVVITRTWTATDECDNPADCPQIIDVRGPSDAIEDLIEFLSGLDIRPRVRQNLLSQLQNAGRSVCRSNAIPAGNQLEAFVNHVSAQSGSAILPGDADELTARAQAIIAAIEEGGACPEGCS